MTTQRTPMQRVPSSAMQITALDVAFVAAAAAVVAPVAGWLTARSTQRHDRGMRLFDEKRLAYVQLLHETNRKDLLLGATIKALDRFEHGYTDPLPKIDPEETLDTAALSDAFLPEK